MKTRILFPLCAAFSAFAIVAAPIVFVRPLPASTQSTDYQPFIGTWMISKLNGHALTNSISVSAAQVNSNSIRLTISHGGDQIEHDCFIANVQGARFLCLPDNNGTIFNIYLLSITNTGTNTVARLELSGISTEQVASDIAQSIAGGIVTEYSQGLKHVRVTNDTTTLQGYISSRNGSFTNSWVTLDKQQ